MVVKFLDVAQSLHDKLLSVAPIEGVSISDESDKSDWRIDFKSSATEQQRKAAVDILENFDVEAVPSRNYVYKEVILDRLGDAGVARILSSTNPSVHLWLEKFRAANDPININDTRFTAGFSFLVSLGILTESDVATMREP
jgi:hypothetical protein